MRAWPLGTIATTVQWIGITACTPIGAIALKRAVDGVIGHRSGALGWFILYLTLGPAASAINDVLANYLPSRQFDTIQMTFTQRLMRACMLPIGLGHLEDPRNADRIELVRQETQAPGYLMIYLQQILGLIASLATAIIALTAVNPILILAPLIAAAARLARARATVRIQDARETAMRARRYAWSYRDMAIRRHSAPDLRMLTLLDWTIGRFRRTLHEDVIPIEMRAERRAAIVGLGESIIDALAISAGIAGLIVLAARGQATIGDVAMGIALLRSVQDHVTGLVSTAATQLVASSRVVARLTDVAAYVPTAVAGLPAPDLLAQGIRLEDVTFRYPSSDEPTLENVTITIPAGTTVALVGPNGAGKTTLIKLLCRFYEPTSGQITVDGQSLSDIDVHHWRQQTSAIFQDFEQYQFSARHAIGCGDLPRLDDDNAIQQALSPASADPVIATLPHGLDTQLGKQFSGGVELSKGQWQKIALARGAMREHPLLVVLDEPTAALDPRAEHEVFERFADLAARGRARGAITLLVSHRFSTVRMADLVIVIEGGRVPETGTHDDLLAANGTYAEMYRIQAQAYEQ